MCHPRLCFVADTIVVEACVELVFLLRGKSWELLFVFTSSHGQSVSFYISTDITVECYSFVCEGSEGVFCSVLLVLCFAGDMMVSSTDLQSVRKTRCVFSPVRVLQMFTASSRAICSACRPRLGVVYIFHIHHFVWLLQQSCPYRHVSTGLYCIPCQAYLVLGHYVIGETGFLLSLCP